eukprot:CAMPEP_0179102412 /NCGR_PEP_ID=MMETSP0796-20121207/47399_1 /TAXON_ID=73915 /ORGANISM="Pyrodinium bahamense, Strain pbaha01" /LENGTH=231 /DNA_ID=CAMNT_0020800287 /DNA_START=246 /DNA_END=937 /DNA_ORIENTATION=+
MQQVLVPDPNVASAREECLLLEARAPNLLRRLAEHGVLEVRRRLGAVRQPDPLSTALALWCQDLLRPPMASRNVVQWPVARVDVLQCHPHANSASWSVVDWQIPRVVVEGLLTAALEDQGLDQSGRAPKQPRHRLQNARVVEDPVPGARLRLLRAYLHAQHPVGARPDPVGGCPQLQADVRGEGAGARDLHQAGGPLAALGIPDHVLEAVAGSLHQLCAQGRAQDNKAVAL